MTTEHTGIIVLAAGASSRMGAPKQLLSYNGVAFLQRAITSALGVGAGATIVVLGANAHEVRDTVTDGHVRIAVNADWQEGIASSIRCGVKELIATMTEAEAVLIMLCDQPFVTTAILNELINTAQHTEKDIVACAYNNIVGVPALFKRSAFSELMTLQGDVGARRVIENNAGSVQVVPFEQGEVDIDTPADYKGLLDKLIDPHRHLPKS